MFGKSDPDPDFPDVTIRFADKGAANFIVRNFSLGAGEAYMQGRLTVDGEDIMGLVKLMTANDLWEHGLGALHANRARRAVARSRIGSAVSTWRAGRRRTSRITL